MKNLIILFIAIIPFIMGCKKDSTPDPDMEIREIAWNYLNAQSQATVNVDWGKAPVSETTFNGISVYAVTFNTSEDELLGPIVVYVEVSSKVAIGQMMRM
jgi:hypothetical protein